MQCEGGFIAEYPSQPHIHVIEANVEKKSKAFIRRHSVREQRESITKATALDERLWMELSARCPSY